MQLNAHSAVHAKFKLVVRSAQNDQITKQTDWFNNLVLDAGLARMSSGTWIDRCCVGTGNSTPVVSQTALDKFLASTTTKQSTSKSIQTTTSPYYHSVIITWRFGEGAAAGNISEVGLGWGNTTLWNRALIKDANGNATTITVLSDEYLDVVSEIRHYPSMSYSGSFKLLDGSGNVVSTHTVTGSPYMATPIDIFGQISPNSISIYSGVKNDAVITAPTTALGSATTVARTYPTTTSVQVLATLELTEANGTHQSFLINAAGLFSGPSGYQNAYKFQISPTITKASTQKMTYTFTLSWGRYAT